MRADYATRLVNRLAIGGGGMLLDDICAMERARGHVVIRPGQSAWLPTSDWKDSTIVAIEYRALRPGQLPNRARLVLLEAKQPRSGALTRLLRHLYELELSPVMVEPHDRLAAKLMEWGWKHRRVGHDDLAETIWYPRP